MKNSGYQSHPQVTGFIKQSRGTEVDELMRFPVAFLLLTQIARRANRTPQNFNPHHLKLGQALIGDHQSIGASLQNYRTAKDQLSKWGFAAFQPTNKGTIATLLDTRIYDINAETSSKPGNKQGHSSSTQNPPLPSTTKKKVKNKESLPSGKARATQKEMEIFCESIGLPKSDGEAMFLHWEEKGWVKNWKLTIRKWKSFGYLPSQKRGIRKSRALSFSEREKMRQDLTEARNVMWRMKEREGREFTSEEAQRYKELTAERAALTAK